MLTWLLILITVVLGSGGDVFCAKGMATGGPVSSSSLSGLGRLVRSIVTRKMVILGWICDGISFFSLLALLSVAQLSIAVPATALSFVVDTLGARFFLREHVHWKRWLGVLCVTAGVLLTVQSSNGKVLSGTRAPTPASVQPHHHQPGHHK